jgi:hypothetical protein
MAETKALPVSVPGTGISSPETGTPPKKKQKRNKPTLSCEECVERKTKVSQLPAIDPWHRDHVRVRAWFCMDSRN